MAIGLTLLIAGVSAPDPTEASARPRLCWRQVDELPAGPVGPARPEEGRPDRLSVTDGAHAPIGLELAPTGRGRASRTQFTTRGVDPQLFVRWPGGGLTWIWARGPVAGMRHLTVGLQDTAPAACVVRGDGAAVLVIEAVSETGQSTCLAWSIAGGAESAPAERSTGCFPVDVPQLVGRTLAEARSILGDLDLVPGTIVGRPAGQPVTSVLSQDPAADSGVELATGDGIDLVIVSERLVRVPAVVGRSVAEARSLLEPLSLGLAAASGGAPVELAAVLDYEVERQDPEAGGSLATGSRVTTEVAFRLPELGGMQMSEALRELHERGLRTASGSYESLPGETAAAYEVALHRPGANELVAHGQEVALEAQTATPRLRGLTLGAAQRRVRDRGLELQRQSAPPADAASERVRVQQPAAGEPLAPGSAVSVTMGVLTPDIEGATVGDAFERLSARGLRLSLSDGTAVERWTQGSVGNRLAAQRPRPGTVTAAGTAVTAELAIQVPNLLWRDPADAAAQLGELGLGYSRPRPRTERQPAPERGGTGIPRRARGWPPASRYISSWARALPRPRPSHVGPGSRWRSSSP